MGLTLPVGVGQLLILEREASFTEKSSGTAVDVGESGCSRMPMSCLGLGSRENDGSLYKPRRCCGVAV